MVFLDGSARAAAQRAVDLLTVIGPSVTPRVNDPQGVIEVLRRHGEPEPVAVTDSDVVDLRETARALWAVFIAESTADAAKHLNAILGAYAHPPRLTQHDNSAWHLHVDETDHGPWAPWFATSSAMAIATLLSEQQRNPAGRCASPTCGKPFIDLGQGDPRRYCSPRCANRERAAAHRRKHHPTPTPPTR